MNRAEYPLGYLPNQNAVYGYGSSPDRFDIYDFNSDACRNVFGGSTTIAPCASSGYSSFTALSSVAHHHMGEQQGVLTSPSSTYKVLEFLGEGTFGRVAKCMKLETRETVAIKILKNQPGYIHQGLIEIRYICETQGPPPDDMLTVAPKSETYFNRWPESSHPLWRLKTPYEIELQTGVKSVEARKYIFSSLDDMLKIKMPHQELPSEKMDRLMFVHLLKRMLAVDGRERITPLQALSHPFLSLMLWSETTFPPAVTAPPGFAAPMVTVPPPPEFCHIPASTVVPPPPTPAVRPHPDSDVPATTPTVELPPGSKSATTPAVELPPGFSTSVASPAVEVTPDLTASATTPAVEVTPDLTASATTPAVELPPGSKSATTPTVELTPGFTPSDTTPAVEVTPDLTASATTPAVEVTPGFTASGAAPTVPMQSDSLLTVSSTPASVKTPRFTLSEAADAVRSPSGLCPPDTPLLHTLQPVPGVSAPGLVLLDASTAPPPGLVIAGSSSMATLPPGITVLEAAPAVNPAPVPSKKVKTKKKRGVKAFFSKIMRLFICNQQ